jgi:hypothetical protein
MVGKIFSFGRDLVRDGYTLVSIIAPLLSIAFTLAKALDMSALRHIPDISYAWALAPLLLWVFVAYVRRRSHTLQSRLKFAAGPNEPGCIRRDVDWHASSGTVTATWFKLKVSAVGVSNVTGCCARLTSVRRDGDNKDRLDGTSVVRPFTPATGADAEKKTVSPTSPELIDVITANASNGVVWLYGTHRDAKLDWDTMFKPPGKFYLTVGLHTDNSVPYTAELLFDWTGDPSTSSLSLIGQNPRA